MRVWYVRVTPSLTRRSTNKFITRHRNGVELTVLEKIEVSAILDGLDCRVGPNQRLENWARFIHLPNAFFLEVDPFA